MYKKTAYSFFEVWVKLGHVVLN